MDEDLGHMRVLDINKLVEETDVKWINYDLTVINDSVVRLGIFEGEYHWHHHDKEDELFLVLSGKLLLDLEDKTVELLPNQGFTIPRGVEHRTRAEEKTVVVMVEGDTVIPAGD